MNSLTVTFVEEDGTEKVIDNVQPGESLMQVGRDNGVEGILGDCGGACACATCHVYVDAKWLEAVGQPDDVESMALEMVSDVQRSNSRLGCQILLREELNGLRVVVAPHG